MVLIDAPSPAINWSGPGLTETIVNGHIESHYLVATGKWTEPKLVADPYLRVNGLAPGLNYGQQCYEGMKAFRTPSNEINLFRPQQHSARLAHSSSFVSIPPIPDSHFTKCVKLAVLLNSAFVPPHTSKALLYIRPLVFGSSAQLALSTPSEFTFCVFVTPASAYHGIDALDALIMEDFDRAAPCGTGSAKVGGNYAPVIRWSDAARREGYGITLHLDSKTRTEIEEFSTSGFLGIQRCGDAITLVVPDSANVIASVTSDSCMTLAKSLGWTVESRRIIYDELGDFTEVIAVGTAACLLPIKSITRKSTKHTFTYNDGYSTPGPCCKIIMEMLDNIMRGQIEDPYKWCVPVS